MGIPSYYKKLINTVNGLVSKGHPSDTIDWLFMDFNCLIYHCLYREDTPEFTGEGKEEWEAQFLECIVKYCLKVIKEVSPKSGVYIAIDGVVPMAKMRQQRLRRFKSSWLASGVETVAWDKNSITPGTLFMKKLKERLETMISKHGKKSWKVSSSDEPGEGEHKIVAEWRTGNYKGNFAVYGLDADLIVLTILGRELQEEIKNVWLFREEVNAGKITYDETGEEIFEWFSISALRDWLVSGFDKVSQRIFILNYCFAMSVLGNDFLPSSLGLKIRDDGHSELLDIIRNMTSNNLTIVDPNTLLISTTQLLQLFKILSNDEDSRITKYIQKKQKMAYIIGNEEETEFKLGENNWPLAHIEESVLLENRQLCPTWKNKYITHFFQGFNYTVNDINRICKEYLYGIQWIWAYYTGQAENVCFNWFYPFNLPPLWQMLTGYLKRHEMPTFPNKIALKASDIKTVEQLALVLPLESWSLIPDCPERSLPSIAPQFYPTTFTFESIGKRFFWECESMIPLPSILEIKEIIRHYT
jgi:5'-3' exonuclease